MNQYAMDSQEVVRLLEEAARTQALVVLTWRGSSGWCTAKAKLLEGRADEIHWDTACSRCAIMLRTGPDVGCVTYDDEAGERFRASRRKGAGKDG